MQSSTQITYGHVKFFFRVPHPGSGRSTKDAENHLKREQNILIQPYGLDKGIVPAELPIDNGISWLYWGYLGKWVADTSTLGTVVELPDNFEAAYCMAVADDGTPELINDVPTMMSHGTLLKNKFRVRVQKQCTSSDTTDAEERG